MSILESTCNLFHIGDNRVKGNWCAFWMPLMQRSMWGIFHDEKKGNHPQQQNPAHTQYEDALAASEYVLQSEILRVHHALVSCGVAL